MYELPMLTVVLSSSAAFLMASITLICCKFISVTLDASTGTCVARIIVTWSGSNVLDASPVTLIAAPCAEEAAPWLKASGAPTAGRKRDAARATPIAITVILGGFEKSFHRYILTLHVI
jgi:hypothetical protein